MSRERIATIVLAAGGSRRLGQPKQLVQLEGRSLIRRAAETAVSANLGTVWVVLGAHGSLIEPELEGLSVTIVHHAGWPEGMGSTIRFGLRQARASAPEAVMLMLCDQPTLRSRDLGILADRLRGTSRSIAASAYGGVRGVPALFRAEVLDELEALGGDAGAKRVIARDPERVIEVPFEGGLLDVDTPRDLARLRERRMIGAGGADNSLE